MKLVTFGVHTPLGEVRRLGALLNGDLDGPIVDLTAAYTAFLALETDEPTPRDLAALRAPPDMIGWLKAAHKGREAAGQALDFVRRNPDRTTGLDGARLTYPRTEVRLLAPLPRPNTMRDFSIYEEHMTRAAPGNTKRPAWYRWPPYYKANPESIIGPEDPIPFPYYTRKLDLEPEIAIVVGKTGSNLTVEEAQDYIAGFTILIDCSCRDGHEREPFGPSKRKDWCNVLGPCLVTADELDDMNMKVRVIVDGEVWFEGHSGHKRNFTAAQLVAFSSDNETLHPGDVLGTGTVGLGCSMDLHRWPQVGQTVTIEMEGIGALTHRIVQGEQVVDYVLNGMDGMCPIPEGLTPR